VKEKLISAYEIAGMVALVQNRKPDAHKMYEEAYKLSDDIFGSKDKRTIEYKTKVEELASSLPLGQSRDRGLKEAPSNEKSPTKITKESVLATTYGTFNGTRLKLIIVDYLKGKSLKIYAMKRDGNFVKSLCLPYDVFQFYFQVQGKAIGPQDIRNESAIEWMMHHISLSADNRLLFTPQAKD